MKGLVMFLIFFLAIFIIGNLYIGIRGWQALEIIGRYRIGYVILFFFVASSFMVAQLLHIDAAFLHKIGSLWVAVMLYAFLILLLIDIVRIAGWATSFKPHFIYQNYMLSKAILFGIVCIIISGTLVWGHSQARYPKVKPINISIQKNVENLHNLKIGMISDIHLGHTNNRFFLRQIVTKLNELDLDLVLLAGDTFDGAVNFVIEQDMIGELDNLKCKYGAFAIMGNHEYIGQREDSLAIEKICKNMRLHRITPLLDSAVLVNNSFYVAGRNDRSVGQRKTIKDLLSDVDKQLPIILLDHQPYHLDEAERAGVDLQLSGHTHHGQMWPLNLITRKVYELDWGYLQKNNTHYYISCGVGTWGPPVRTAGYSEIVLIQMKFN